MCCCYCKSRFSKFPLISGVTKTLFNMVKKFEVNRTISKFSIICSLETFINQRDQTFLARSIRARITREKFLHVQKNVNIHTVKSVKSIRNILCLLKIRLNLERNGGAMISLVMKVFEIWMLVLTVTELETVEF